QPARTGIQLATARARSRERDRGRDLAGAGRAEHRRGGGGAVGKGTGGDRSDHVEGGLKSRLALPLPGLPPSEIFSKIGEIRPDRRFVPRIRGGVVIGPFGL